MRLFICLLLFIPISMTVYAQEISRSPDVTGSISGKVKDAASGQPMEYATVTLYDSSGVKTLSGTVSDKSGVFLVSNLPAGRYKLTIEFIGYQAYSVPHVLSVNNREHIDLKTILLTKDAKLLGAVTVTAQSKLIDNRIDKMVFNAEKDLTSQTGVATDILKKVPQVSVDVDGNVELSGNASIRFLINGKPSTAFGSNIADVLQSIPASQIKSIEVITNPGAKYDAQGLGGIINIILKQNNARGINSSMSATAGTRVENGSFNFNARNKNIGFNAFVSGNARLAVNTASHSSRISNDAGNQTTLNTDAIGRVKRHGLESGMGFDWTLKKKNNFTATFNYNDFGNDGTRNTQQLLLLNDTTRQNISQVLSYNHSSNTAGQHNADFSVGYKRSFDKEDQELTVLVNSSFGTSRGMAGNEQHLLPADSLYYGIIAVNPGRQHETQVQIDYAQPLSKKVMLGVGGKASFFDINSSSSVNSYRPLNKAYLFDSSLSNALTYNQKVYAAYAELTFPLANLFDVKIGSRYERTENRSFFSQVPQQVQSPGYNTLVPSVFFSRKLGDNQLIKVSYSKRIERPDYGDLNPFINTSDPKNISAGNPYLKPELGQRYELSYSKDFGRVGSFIATVFYRHNSQDIQPYTKYYASLQVGDSVYKSVSISTRENIGTENNVGLNLFASLHVTAKLDLRINAFLFRRNIINEIDKGLARQSFNYRSNINASYQFNALFAAEFFGNFNSARNEVQGKYPSFTSYSFAFRKIARNKKTSLALTAVNPFNEYITQRLELYGSNFTQTSLQKIPFRSIGLNFTWKFGKLAFKKDKEDNSPDLSAPQQ